MSEWRKNDKGYKTWKNKRNGYFVTQLHYTADPDKRKKEWIEQESKGIPYEDWAVEYEMSRKVFLGDPVYGKEFRENWHILKENRAPIAGIDIFRGWDFGGSQSCAFAQFIGPKLFVIDELPNAGYNALAFAPLVIQYSNTNFGPDFNYIDIVDPSGFHNAKTGGGKAEAEYLRDAGLTPIAGATQDKKLRRAAVLKYLMTQANGMPCFEINPKCAKLIGGFKGGFMFKKTEHKIGKMDWEKNDFSHIHEGLQYLATRSKYIKPRFAGSIVSNAPGSLLKGRS